MFALIFTVSLFVIPEVHATGGIISDQQSCGAIVGGTWSNSNTCTITCTSSCTTSVTINSGDTIKINHGVILVNSGAITNYGIIINSGIIENTYTGLYLSGNIVNRGIISNDGGTINNNFGTGGTIGSYVANWPDGTIYNFGKIVNSANFNNYGMIKNQGTIINNVYTFINWSNGEIDLTGGIIQNLSSISNMGTIFVNYYGTLKGGLVINDNTITDNCRGKITSLIQNHQPIYVPCKIIPVKLQPLPHL